MSARDTRAFIVKNNDYRHDDNYLCGLVHGLPYSLLTPVYGSLWLVGQGL